MQEQNPGGVTPTNPPSVPQVNPNISGQPPTYAPPQGTPQPYQSLPYTPPPAPAPPKMPMAALGAGCGAVALMAILGLGAGLYLSGRSAPPAPMVAPAPVATSPAITETPDDAQPSTQSDATNTTSGNAASSGVLPETQDAPAYNAAQSGTTEAAGVGGPEPITGSYANQTTLRANTNGDHPMTVYVNGRKVAEFQDSLTLDISKMVKPGENTLRMVPRQQKTLAWATVAYAKQKNQFGTVANMTLDTGAGEDKTLTFIAPSS